MSGDAIDARERMVREQLADRGIRSGPVLEAFRRIDRAAFVPSETRTGLENIIASKSLFGAAKRLFGTLGS